MGIAYAVMGWLLVEVATTLLPTFQAPEWVAQVIVMVIALGFIPALIFAWVFELTPEGLKRESDIDRAHSITTRTGHRLDLITIAAVIVGVGFVVLSRDGEAPDTDRARSTEPPAAAQAPVAPQSTSSSESPDDDLSIAVLPFVNMSQDVENEYFADGLSEEILNRLAQVPQLRVIARTSSFAFKGDNRDLREIGDLLDVAHLLEGSVRRQGDQVRITAQLIAAGNGSHLWSRTYDETMDDVFAIQDQIAQQVVDALDIVLDEAARQEMLASGIRNVEAFVAYQRGVKRSIEAHGKPDVIAGLVEANRDFDRALEVVPEFAAALLAKADYYAHQVLEAETETNPLAHHLIDDYAALGERQAANAAAAALDARPGGSIELLRVINSCACGAPFDLEATPNLASRIEQAGLSWPPPRTIDDPAKDW